MRCPWMLVMGLAAVSVVPPRLSRADAPTEEQRAQLYAGLAELQGRLEQAEVERRENRDAAVFAKAVEWLLRHEEFGRKRAVDEALQVLEWGDERAGAILDRSNASPGRRILAYRSSLDGSLQPYALTLPRSFVADANRSWPLHVVLHGRGDDLNETAFIAQHEGQPADNAATWIQLDVYGRGNNAYRWAGEVDVFEALADVQKRFAIDDRRITLWGFSMGGAGAWHLGLHHPDRWSSVGAGAGFVDFYKYQKVDKPLPDYQERTLRIYDSAPYALNLADVPFMTYGGENDPQLAASLAMQQEAEKLSVPLKVLIGPKMGHQFDDASFGQFMAFHAMQTLKGRSKPPGNLKLRFVTCTTKYNRCDWLRIEELERPYEPTTVESTFTSGQLNLATRNARALAIARDAAAGVSIDKSPAMSLRDSTAGRLSDAYFVREATGWKLLDAAEAREFVANSKRHKRHDLQGPIDDAFMTPFVCVRGTSRPWNTAHQSWADWSLARMEREWDKWFRGQARVVNDSELREDEIADGNLILFGDPGSNSVLAKIVDRLPVKWTEKRFTIGGKVWDTASHGLALIFPNPLNPRRYVVINSGPTIHEEDFKKSNAWLFPKLGDAAVLKLTSAADGGFVEDTVWATIFNSDWEIEP